VNQPVLEMHDVCVDYDTDDGVVHAVCNASYELYRDETLALVGESGCGKSQSSYAAMGLIQPPGRRSGRIIFRGTESDPGRDLIGIEQNSRTMRAIRGGPIAMVFQEPMTALSPVHRIGFQMDEALRLHTTLDKKARFERACEMLTRVGIPDAARRYRQYSFEFSGGMRQRIMIAIALACNPVVLFADEPTTGLDVTIQAQILNLIKSLQNETHMALVLITHDLAVVAENADRVAVMYLGRIVEMAPVDRIYRNPLHPYTVALLRSVIGSPLASDGRLHTIKGTVPPPLENVPGCPFHPRCERFIQGLCEKVNPPMQTIEDGIEVACHLYGDGADKEEPR
jgi:peptide/nickel transport system ATP-binding protein